MSYLKYAIQVLCEVNFDPIDQVLKNATSTHIKLMQHLDQIKPDENSPEFNDYCDYVSSEIDREDINYKIAVQLSIVGLYLTLEIGMTKLVRICFDDIAPNKLRSFDSFTKALAKKGVNITILSGYETVAILRIINNVIKHSESVETEDIEKLLAFVDFDNTYQEHKLVTTKLHTGYSGFKGAASSFFNALRNECTNKLPI